MITMRDLTFQYKGSSENALCGVQLTVEQGDFLGIIGASGAGKSTLLSVISGVVPHHNQGDFYGSCVVDGMDTVEVTMTDISRVVGSVFQDIDGQMVSSVVEDEVLFALENFGFGKAEIERRLSTALEQVGIAHLRNRSLDSLSGGQKQKVALAAMMALQPKVLVLDEPTGELDPASSRQFYLLLRELNRQNGTTVVVVEQKIMLLCEFAKRLAVMDGGKIARIGTVREMLAETDVLEELGVHCPRVASLCTELRRRGLYAGQTPIDVEEGVRMVREVTA